MYTHQDNKVTGLTVAYIGGGSRGWAWGFMRDIISDGQISGTVRLYDIDREAAERNQKIGTMLAAHPDAASKWTFEVSSSLQEALT
ncbi:alpha-glucosidase/alpha-galactosidase, partial [Xanthomonas citri pv. citri]|nr:alpha-glucosidase/alpha-galactosidase [Xanthomonas citri pv. citri]